ncbi:TRI15 protein [Colletotrichum kahawae]|uniref:TRI15 protein n=1 Tax=Colletotrichum kahawae TaxID=34407 RepID=A0AAD9Y3W4_COLKA|nr:TRI15 protein [Colletotrichum kahawae]
MTDSDQSHPDESFESYVRSFDPTRCLFCNHVQNDLHQNIIHMHRRHSFIVPNKDYLAVDTEKLMECLHSVILKDAQCICCGSIRGSFHAAQQHMLHKGHCRIDVCKGSEFREFYHFDFECDFSDDSDDRDGANDVIMSNDDTKSLEGKKLLHRNARGHCHLRYALFGKDQQSTT